MTEETPQIMAWIQSVLNDNEIVDYQDPVPDMGLEFITSYLTRLVEDVVIFADHAGNTNPNLNDVNMAIKMRHRQTSSTSKEQLRERISACNVTKLPRDFQSSIELPKPQDDTFTLLQRNYRVRTNEDYDDDDDDEMQEEGSQLPLLPPTH
ncbi:Transcription initiation factor TFIID subunit 9 [Entamoeba marina]